MSTVLIIGCGDIGWRVAGLHRARGDRVLGVVRTDASARRLRREGIEPVVLDLDRLAASLPAADLVYHFAPPQAEGTADVRSRALLARLPVPHRLVYISTSGVYGDHGGAWVDETTPPRPQTDRARRRLDAEQQLLAWGGGHGAEVVILRVGGIYGPGRLPLERLDGMRVVCPDEAPHSNRIHADDLAMMCVLVAERGVAGEIYNAAADEPSTMTDYFYAVADAVGKPRPPCISMAEARRSFTPGMLSYLSESRRMSTRKIKALGAQLRYPTLRTGLAACLAAVDPSGPRG